MPLRGDRRARAGASQRWWLPFSVLHNKEGSKVARVNCEGSRRKPPRSVAAHNDAPRARKWGLAVGGGANGASSSFWIEEFVYEDKHVHQQEVCEPLLLAPHLSKRRDGRDRRRHKSKEKEGWGKQNTTIKHTKSIDHSSWGFVCVTIISQRHRTRTTAVVVPT